MLIDFQNSFTKRLTCKFAIKNCRDKRKDITDRMLHEINWSVIFQTADFSDSRVFCPLCVSMCLANDFWTWGFMWTLYRSNLIATIINLHGHVRNLQEGTFIQLCMHITALKFFWTCVTLKLVDDDDDDYKVKQRHGQLKGRREFQAVSKWNSRCFLCFFSAC